LLSELGAKLIVVGRNEKTLKKTVDLLMGDNHVIKVFDLVDVDSIPSMMKECAKAVGPFNGVVHSAGIHLTKPLRTISYLDIKSVMDVNIAAMFGLAKGYRQNNVYSSPSSFVVISSVMGMVGQPAVSVYSASKGAIVSAVKSIALELARQNIRVNCVAPGQVQTEMADEFKKKITEEDFERVRAMHPLGLGTTRDVANCIAFLLADTSRWITGSTVVVDGGYTAH
jgi:3-oxoacyl-[acyl-carrier protein] reductase